MRAFAQIARRDSRAEQQASDVASRATRVQPPPAPLTASTSDGARSLTPAGRAHFEPIVGAPLDRANIRVDADADRVTRLAHADAVTCGRDVFIPPSRFAPETSRGHALLAHELAHIPHAAAAPGTVFRQGDAHYPSEAEQRELEKIAGRDTKLAPTPATPAGSPPAPTKVVDAKKTMSTAEINAMADRLVGTFEQAFEAAPFEKTGEADVVLADAKAAMENTQKALSAIYEKFGAYLDPARIRLTDDQTLSVDQLGATRQVQVTYGWDPNEPETFAVNAMTHFCPACEVELAPYAEISKRAVRVAVKNRLKTNTKLWAKIVTAAKHSVGGSHAPGTHAVRLTPYGKDPYPNAVHELLHEFTHPAFEAAFNGGMTEPFTEYFTEEITGKPQPENGATTITYDLSQPNAMRAAMAGPIPGWHSDEAEESLRQAYFKGRLDLIGWRGTEAEEKAVEGLGGRVWDPAVAAKELEARNARALAAQSPHSNLIGLGLFVPLSGGSMLSMRYARVFHAKPPFATSQLYLEGQVVGTITGDPRRVGGSIGLGYESQKPGHYFDVGARVLGTAAISGPVDPSIALQPFAGVGLRFMHVRAGVEGFVLVPSTGKDVTAGATVMISVEK